MFPFIYQPERPITNFIVGGLERRISNFVETDAIRDEVCGNMRNALDL